jgi:hypothetical protein
MAPNAHFCAKSPTEAADKKLSELTMVSAVSGASKDELRKLSEFSYPA